MYSLHIIGALIKERAIGPLVQKSKRHHSPDSEEAPLSTHNIISSGTTDNFAKDIWQSLDTKSLKVQLPYYYPQG